MRQTCLFGKIVVLILFWPITAWSFEALFIRAIDGDSIKVVNLSTRSETSIRLYGIDAPEYNQPHGQAAKQFVEQVIGDPGARLQIKKMGKSYDRIVGMVKLSDGRILNQMIIQAGLAWVYDKYCRKDFCTEWRCDLYMARQRGLGVWDGSGSVEPWRWRVKNF